jgi:hypothetical protein
MFQQRSESVLPQVFWPQIFQKGGLEVDILVVRMAIDSRIKANATTRKVPKRNPESILR